MKYCRFKLGDKTFRLISWTVLALMAAGPVWAERIPGVVVEEVAPNSGAAKAGLQSGDILQRWTRADAGGEINSPFDFSQVLREQVPRGAVQIEGLRGSEAHLWIFQTSVWAGIGIRVRPQLPEAILPGYLAGQQAARAGNLSEAGKRWKSIAAEVDDSQAPWLRAWLSFRAAQSSSAARQWEAADASYDDAVPWARKASATYSAEILRDWANSFQQRNDPVGAERHWRDALTESEKLVTPNLSQAATFYALGLLSWSRADLAKAEEYYQQSLAIRQKLAPGSLLVSGCLNGLGNVADNRGDLLKAEEYHRQSLAISQKIAPGGREVASSLNNLANLAEDRGDLVQAEDYQRQALEIFRKLAPGSQDHAGLLNNLGLVVFKRGDLFRAEEYEHEALEIRQKLDPDGIDVAMSFTNLGDLSLAREDLVNAEKYYKQAIAIQQKLAPGSLTLAATLSGLGDVAWQRQDVTGAEEYRRAALAIQQKLAPFSLPEALYLTSLADVVRKRGDLDTAEKYYRQALTIRQQLAPQSTDHAEALAALASIERQRGHLDVAAQLYEQALDALENQVARLGGTNESRANFRGKHTGYYRDYADVLVAQKQPELAFAVLERSRARALLEILAAAQADIRQGVNPVLVQRERSLQQLLSAKSARRLRLLGDQHSDEQSAVMDREIKQLLAEYNDVEEQIRTTSPRYAALTQPRPLGAKQIQQLLDPGTLLLEYSLGEERSHVFALTADRLNVYELPPRAEIEGTARQVYKLLAARDDDHARILAKSDTPGKVDLRDATAALSQMILGPVAAEIAVQRLVVVGDGALQYIPFAALPEPAQLNHGKEMSLKKAVPLMVGHEIINLPSASVLAALRQQTALRNGAAKEVAVLADPVFDRDDDRVAIKKQATTSSQRNSPEAQSEGPSTEAGRMTRSVADVGLQPSGSGYLRRLPYTRREAQAILAVTPPGQGMQALDFEASRTTATSAQLAQYRIVHVATHGLLDSEHPELSGLVLSMVDEQGNPQNGFLDLADIYNLNLAADLVVLSACETALGKEIQGEGLLGLTRGFMYAGVKSVVASLWDTDDEATAALMTRFYNAVERKKLAPAAALREAQIETWKQKRWAAPYYWAGFQLQGEWK
jgi:CHAT domain-containing protein/Tfp pilus assembly protein PilF